MKKKKESYCRPLQQFMQNIGIILVQVLLYFITEKQKYLKQQLIFFFQILNCQYLINA